MGFKFRFILNDKIVKFVSITKYINNFLTNFNIYRLTIDRSQFFSAQKTSRLSSGMLQ